MKVDKELGNVLVDLSRLSLKKENLTQENKSSNFENLLLYNNKKISEIDLYFILPGTNIELKTKGAEIQVNSNNFEEYIKLIYENLCGKGIKEYITAFKNGFNKVFDVSSLKCFQTNELEEIICGSTNEIWDFETLSENIIPNHGYDRNSSVYKYLLNFLMEMSLIERRKFLLFATGCPRLPLGGINLYNFIRF